MNLIIIDDQTSVVNGLYKGVKWERAGVEHVLVAYNAFEAKRIFAEQPVDIMLCDIEMPVESGLMLYKWVKDSGYDVECIFLTAHAEFEYARKAISLKSFDYIVQPAPYEEVEAVVTRAVARVNEKKADKKIRSYGKYLMEKNTEIQNRMLNSYLTRGIDRKSYEEFARLENMISLEQEGYLVFLQVMRQTLSIDKWEPALMQFTFMNVISEWFAPYGQTVILCDVSKSEYAIVIFGQDSYCMDYPGVLRQLEACKESFAEYLKCDAAFYANSLARIEEMPDIIDKMMKVCKENVSQRSEVFDMCTSMPRRALQSGYVQMNMNRWESYIYQNLDNVVKEEIFQFLDHAAQQGYLTPETLLDFHMEFSKLVFKVAEHRKLGDAREWLKGRTGEMLYTKAQVSLNDMKTLVAFALEHMKSVDYDNNDQKNQVKMIEDYIHDHLECEITREDISEYVHLNVDYLGRIFKKDKGISLKEYIIEEKMRVARNLLRTTMLPVSLVASKVGYSNFSHFSRIYKKIFGISPTEERK